MFVSIILALLLPKTVTLSPPPLSSESVLEKICCTRPGREDGFNISVEKQGRKTLVNCYGHGGSGWTTLFGSVERAITLFEKEGLDKTVPIRVIGSGCMGLTSAIELKKMGYNVSGISTKSLYDLPSWKAGGYFALTIKDLPEESQKILNDICVKTFQAYQKIERGEHSYISQEAVRYMPVFCSIGNKTGLEPLEECGAIPPKEYVTLDFGNGIVRPNFVKYMSYFMNTTTLMEQLSSEVKRQNIAVTIETIDSFDQIEEEVIFNCAGLGARELNADAKMYAISGHLLTLKQSDQSGHLDYMITARVVQDDKPEYIYMFPKTYSVSAENPQGSPCSGVLGGTFIPHTDQLSAEELENLNKKEFERLLKRLQTFFYGKSF